jgi:hypothetical protein
MKIKGLAEKREEKGKFSKEGTSDWVVFPFSRRVLGDSKLEIEIHR